MRFFLFVLLLLFCLLLTKIYSYVPSLPTTFRFDSLGLCIQPHCFVDVRSREEFRLQNVLGDGDCVFRAVRLLSNNTAVVSRFHVAQCLMNNTSLFITSANDTVGGHALLRKAAVDLSISVTSYIDSLMLPGRQGGLYAGGPELTVLSNLLRRSIRVYEPVASNEQPEDNLRPPYKYVIEPKGVFGTVFDDTDDSNPPIHLFIFKTGEINHACALIPSGREEDFLL